MNCKQNHYSPHSKSAIVQQSLELRLKIKNARYYLKWGFFNIFLLAILLFDISNKCQFVNSTMLECWFWLEYILIGASALSAIVCFLTYLGYVFRRELIRGTDAQKVLLFDNNDNSFTTEQQPPAEKKSNVEQNQDDTPIINWHSSFEDSSWNFNRSTPYHRLSPNRTSKPQQQNISAQTKSTFNGSLMNNSSMSCNSAYMSPYAQSTRDDFIKDERSLNAYLAEISRRENNNLEFSDINQTSSGGPVNSFWNYCNSAAHMLKTSIYQLAPQQMAASQNKQQSSNDDGGTIHYIDTNSEIIKRYSTETLSQYVANLRLWISRTILQCLVKEISNIDAIFRQRGLIDMKIGNVGFERLRKTAENQQFVNQCAPMLPVLLPFLDLCVNQEYLVQRIKDLAEGSCIGDYRWNSGGSYNGQKWSEHLPTDSAILFHLFCVYLDSQLMPLPQGGGRPFFSRYVLLRKDKRSVKDTISDVHNKAQCAILYTDVLKPKFNFISDKVIHNCSYDRNNLFYVLVQFIIYMRRNQGSTLEGIHLGKSGVNILCVIED